MKILIACEESQAVCKEFRALGHEAWSCDILECSGGAPQWHIQGDVLKVINDNWDMMVGFPPCTFLTVTANKWMNPEFEKRFPTRKQDREEAIDFFMQLYNSPVKHIALENPIGIMSTRFRKPDQIIQPYYFGDATPKSTCLWLKNLPKLKHIKQDDLFNIKTHVQPQFIIGKRDGKKYSLVHYMTIKTPDRAKLRSKTFPGIAKAMAQQWSAFLKETAVSKTAVTET